MHKFVFFGTPEFSTFVLDELSSAGWIPTLVVTTPDKPAGRGLTLLESPVKRWARAHDIPVLQPAIFDDATRDALNAVGAEFAVVAAYGRILPASILRLFPKGALNVHPSLLPRYRGTSPVESQILADEKQIGVSVILMDELMDHGPILTQGTLGDIPWPIGRDALNDALWHAGGEMLAEIIPLQLAGKAPQIPQDESLATVTKKIRKEDGALDLSAPGRANFLKYLAYEGWPGTYFFDNGKRVKIVAASLKNGIFIIERVVPEGKREMAFEDWRRNARA